MSDHSLARFLPFAKSCGAPLFHLIIWRAGNPPRADKMDRLQCHHILDRECRGIFPDVFYFIFIARTGWYTILFLTVLCQLTILFPYNTRFLWDRHSPLSSLGHRYHHQSHAGLWLADCDPCPALLWPRTWPAISL
jgi:hypothetical protein